MFWVNLIIGVVLVRVGVTQDIPEEQTTTVKADTENSNDIETTTRQVSTAVTANKENIVETTTQIVDTTVIADTTVIVDTTVIDDTEDSKPVETTTTAVNMDEEDTEEETAREECLYKQKRPGFTCNSGECIDRGGVCDKHNDCSDGSDESPSVSCCSSNCITATMGSVCIPADGYNNTGVDCRSCSKSGYPGYRCDDGACIYRRKVCDGRSQCKDDSDEKYCAFHLCQTDLGALVNVPRDMLDMTGDCRRCDYNSEGDGWRCNNAKCILAGWKCDGSEDCTDGSDETDQLCNPQPVVSDRRTPKLKPQESPVKEESRTAQEEEFPASQAPGPCPSGWSCIKYSDCSEFSSYVERGGLFADLRCSSDQLSKVCCDPQGEWKGFGTNLTDYDEL